MASFTSGYTWADGNTVTAALLNSMIGGMTVSGIVGADLAAVLDLSASKVTIGSIGAPTLVGNAVAPSVIHNLSPANLVAGNELLLWVPGTPITISSLSATGYVATANTATAHGFTTGQLVTITGVTPSGYNGDFVIAVTSSTSFTYTVATSGLASGSGTMVATLNTLQKASVLNLAILASIF